MSPRGRTKALEQMQPRTTASSGGALTMPTANKAIHTAQGPWPLQGPCLSRAQRHLPGQKSEPKHQACLTEACRCEAGSAGGPGHPSLVTILTAGVARNPIHPAAAAPAGVSRALGNEGGEERRSGQRREQCPSPTPVHAGDGAGPSDYLSAPATPQQSLRERILCMSCDLAVRLCREYPTGTGYKDCL